MELNSIKDAFDRVTKKQKLSASKSQEVVDQIIQEIEQTLSKLTTSEDPMSQTNSTILTELKAKLNGISPLSNLESTQKELNIALTKYPKLLEKSFNPDISKAYRNIDFNSHLVNQIIASHFYREGLFELGDFFISEAGETEEEAASLRTPFLEMSRILESMKNRELGPALSWAAANRDKLKQNGSDLELKLHRLQFIEILQNSGRDEGLKYVRTFLVPFATEHMEEIQRLTACVLWAGRLEKSPYSELLSEHCENFADELTRQYCNILGQSCKSPLSATVMAGIQGLPTLLKLMNVMMGKKQEWLTMKQLPVPLDLDREFQFHSVFVCPVSREQASEENPPMLLSCGHVLCKQSITKLSKNNSTRPFKCPYCPSEVEAANCRQLYF
ncbi:protein RMD5 homolog [Impatiens glandulifera]|uniref:protein RMD5 homolog n=1 Tax=Impatiens glandulifera TaxID=253017 RepID=UPI001FB10497|nr:protein RMD5 homolog [Impatiens glandulifera]